MRINNNLMAMNTHRQLGIVTDSGAKATEKLSSGFRINRAGDDAAGLAISEKMRGQIRGLNMASKNAQDGISLIQTAEGALQETHAILQRMRELAVQSASDTNVEVDREEIQKEINQLAEEITRIADTTEFNTQNLLGGKFEAKFHVGANEGQNVELKIEKMDSKALEVAGRGGPLTEVSSASGGKYLGVDAKVLKAGDDVVAVEISGAYYAASDVIKTTGDALAVAVGTKELDVKTDGIAVDGKIVDYEIVTNGYTVGKDDNDDDVKADAVMDGDKVIAVKTTDGKYYVAEDVELGGDDNKDTVAKAGAEEIKVEKDVIYIEASEGGIDVSTQVSADKAITVINKAIETVSAERSMLGAMQNRLEHTIKNLDTSAENLQASESRIRDVDMAKEMMEFTKQNILQQASTAMLAQANMAPQSVLQLLR